MRRSGHVLLLFAFLATGCTLLKPDAQTQAFASGFLASLEAGDSAAIVSKLDPGLTSYSTWTKLAEVRDSLLAVHRNTTDLVEWSTFKSSDNYTADLIYQLHGARWAILEMRVERRQGALLVTGMHVETTKSSLAEMNSFVFSGRPARFYFVVVGAIVSLLCCLTALIFVLRTKMMPRRWLWSIVALIGVCQYTINWSTGEGGWSLLRVQLFGAGALRSGISPWLVSFSAPLGAACALWHRHQFLTRASRAETPIVEAKVL
jgi:hypothetical protein